MLIEPHDMRLLELQFSRVLDCDNAFIIRYKSRHHIKHGRLAGTGTSGNQDIQAGVHDTLENLPNGIRDRTEFLELHLSLLSNSSRALSPGGWLI